MNAPASPLLATRAAPLACHPSTPTAAVRAIDVALAWRADGGLALEYTLTGDPRRIVLPAPTAAAPADGLWVHTCAEAFLGVADEAGYREFNFSPSTQWAIYAFSGYRERAPLPVRPAPPRIVVTQRPDAVVLAALVPAEMLPAGARLRLGLSVVVEDADGGLSYWALRHPAAHPDFHHRDAFALEVAAPSLESIP